MDGGRVSGSATATGETRAIGRHSLADNPGREGPAIHGQQAARSASPISSLKPTFLLATAWHHGHRPASSSVPLTRLPGPPEGQR